MLMIPSTHTQTPIPNNNHKHAHLYTVAYRRVKTAQKTASNVKVTLMKAPKRLMRVHTAATAAAGRVCKQQQPFLLELVVGAGFALRGVLFR